VEEEAIEIEEELVEDDSISSEESDFESSCGGTSSDSEDVGSGDSWSTYSFVYMESDSESESNKSDGSSMKKSRRLHFSGETCDFENFMDSWKIRGAKKGL